MRLLSERSPAAHLVVRQDSTIEDCTRRACEFLGGEPRVLVGRALFEFVAPDCHQTLELHLTRTDRQTEVDTCELRLISVDQAERDILVQTRRLADRSGRRLMCLCDISSWRNADPRRLLVDEQLRHSQKMEALGRLTAGIAHDFNNLLTLITGYSRILLDDSPSDDPRRGYIDKIARAGKQATDLVGQLLTFGRNDQPTTAVVDLNSLLVNFEAMLQRIIGQDIELEALLDPHLEQIRIVPNELDQALMNLAVNARDAMPDGGTLTFETCNVYVGENRPAALEELAPGPYVKLSIRDTGSGMCEQTASRIFEPFFTTKGIGQGTGLGLATTRTIVRNYGGAITVETGLGEGTRFELYFPVAESGADPIDDDSTESADAL